MPLTTAPPIMLPTQREYTQLLAERYANRKQLCLLRDLLATLKLRHDAELIIKTRACAQCPEDADKIENRFNIQEKERLFFLELFQMKLTHQIRLVDEYKRITGGNNGNKASPAK